jgi:hypothetical protein
LHFRQPRFQIGLTVSFDLVGFGPEIRARVEKDLGVFPSDDAWDRWYAPLDEDDFMTADQVVQQLVEDIKTARDSMPRKPGAPAAHKTEDIRFDPPPWWGALCRRKVREFSAIQKETRAVLHLDRPVTAGEQDALLFDLLRRQQKGPNDFELVLEFARVSGDGLRAIEKRAVYAGNTLPFSRNHAYVLDGEQMSFSGQPLFWLANAARTISWESGCEPYEAVDYLLRGTPFEWRWIEIRPRHNSSVIELRIGTPLVPISDVVKAYKSALAWERAEQPKLFTDMPSKRRRPKARTGVLREFVEQRTTDSAKRHDWVRLHTEWNDLHPDWAFPTRKAMGQRYREAVAHSEQG